MEKFPSPRADAVLGKFCPLNNLIANDRVYLFLAKIIKRKTI